MDVKSNRELVDAIEEIISESGIKKIWLADKLGIANQNFNKFLHKKNMSLDEANKILSFIGYTASISIQKEEKK